MFRVHFTDTKTDTLDIQYTLESQLINDFFYPIKYDFYLPKYSEEKTLSKLSDSLDKSHSVRKLSRGEKQPYERTAKQRAQTLQPLNQRIKEKWPQCYCCFTFRFFTPFLHFWGWVIAE